MPPTLPVDAGVDYRLPPYDIDALLIEAELLLDWYLPRSQAHGRRRGARRLSSRCGARRSRPRCDAPPTWVLRDYHSPNLLWLPEREGIARIGLLDFQDAVMGPAAYDVASLLQDARVDVPELMEIALLGALRHARGIDADASFDAPAFARALCHARRAARLQDPRHLRPARRGATASRNICVTCRAYGAICSARWRIPRWRELEGLVRRACAGAERAMTEGADDQHRAMVLAAGLGSACGR